MRNKIAALDLGSNTFHLLLAEVSETGFEEIRSFQKDVRLAENGLKDARITAAAFNRGIAALSEFRQLIEDEGITNIHAVGTSALRSTENGPAFIEQAKADTGIEIRIISGDLEAELIYKGVRASAALNKTSLIIDIGGGSVEFIIADSSRLLWKKSYAIGAARLMASFHFSDPISRQNVETLTNYLDEQLSDLWPNIQNYKPVQLVGSAGSFETFAALVSDKFQKETPLFDHPVFDFKEQELLSVIDDIILSDHNQRMQNDLIIPVRKDMIVVASVLVKYMMARVKFQEIKLSRFALKEGLLFADL